ncbi:MAG: aminopeptidase P family protein [Bacteroidaceae bacterium]|nr:aminopeptidase P family protein [Bacteroidaceae bacterium]
METVNRIAALRKLMEEWGWSAAIIVSGDPHDSEYTPLRWCQRQFISGFTGSAGIVVVTAHHAGLWVDSRYHIQASRELQGSGIELHKMVSVEESGWMDWLAMNLPDGSKVGVDGLCISIGDAGRLQEMLRPKRCKVVSRPDFLDAIWPDRPGLPQDAVWIHEECYSGRSAKDKLEWFRNRIAGYGCSHALVSRLDQVAWLLNIRSNDIAFSPLVISYALVEPDGVVLFAEESKFTPEVLSILARDGISVRPYHSVCDYLSSMQCEGSILVDTASLNFELGRMVYETFGAARTVAAASPIDVEKACKNAVEADGFRRAYIADGVAQTRFFRWLERSIGEGSAVTESDAADMLHSLRAENPDFLDESFETISAYGANAALPHYSTVRGKDSLLQPRGLYLNDSGAHYRYGTTDITRTVPLGPLTELERQDYTIDLKAMIDLSVAVFPEGTPGCRLDAVARRPLWQTMRDFGHGTGHGVGNLLNVHEGPQTIRQNLKNQSLLPGMITSNEPGIYREGHHGVRHENMILCKSAGSNEFGKWLCFETLTMTYIDTTPILTELLDPAEREWLNTFNGIVYDTLRPYLTEDEAKWLRSKTIRI